jgi:uncharacterized protein (DUF1501 family)
MNSLTRRRFLAASGVTATVAAGAAVGWFELIDRARTDPLPTDAHVLVMLTLYGGNDGLGTVIPAADPAYQQARPDLAYAEHEVLPLGEGLGLNPGMTGLKKLWDDRHLAIVRGVSYPQPDHSHFRSMAIWQTASPTGPLPTGWLGRWLDASGSDPLLAVSIGPVLPPMLAGATTAGAALPLGGLTLPQGALGRAFTALGRPSPGEPAQQAAVAAAVTDLHRAVAAFASAVNTTAKNTPTAHTNRGGGGALAAQLDVVARCIEIGAPSRVYCVSLGGFDTHADERGTQQRLLTQVDAAVTAFLDRMASTDRGRKVVLAAYSEFGRRVAANASQGTDHGTSGPVLIAGQPVTGGFYGDQPSLTDLDDGDLKTTTDFRDTYATLLAKVLNTDPARILGPGRTVATYL